MDNDLKLKRIHHVEFWVGNARQAAYYYRKGFGFSQFGQFRKQLQAYGLKNIR